MRRIVRETLGSSNRDAQRVEEVWVNNAGWVQIRWAINDNLTAGLIKNSAKKDIMDVGEALCEAGYCDGLTMQGSFPLVDQYGNTNEVTVVGVVFTPETLARINWESLLLKNVYVVADSVELHPTFQD